MNEATKQYLESHVHYWIGRLEMANYWVNAYSKLKSKWGKAQLRAAKASQKEALEKIKELSR